ncbi:MAG TPA: phosphatase PAP2 family protein [Cytophagaceae bacterium]
MEKIFDWVGRKLVKPFHSRYLQNQRLVRRALITLIIFLLAAFLSLTFFILITPDFFYDIHFSKEVQEDSCPFLDRVMKAISWFGNDYVIIISVPLVSLMFFLAKYYRQAIFILFTLYANVIVFIIKYFVNRPRPGEDIVRVITKVEHSGFPSGHVTHYVVFFGFLTVAVFTVKELPIFIKIIVAVFCMFLIAVVPISRIYLGVHYLTDVMGGGILGIILLIILLYFFFKNKNNPSRL